MEHKLDLIDTLGGKSMEQNHKCVRFNRRHKKQTH